MTSSLFLNVLLMVIGPFVVVGLTAIPALLQWPAPARPQPSPTFPRPRRQARPAYRMPAPAFGGAYA